MPAVWLEQGAAALCQSPCESRPDKTPSPASQWLKGSGCVGCPSTFPLGATENKGMAVPVVRVAMLHHCHVTAERSPHGTLLPLPRLLGWRLGQGDRPGTFVLLQLAAAFLAREMRMAAGSPSPALPAVAAAEGQANVDFQASLQIFPLWVSKHWLTWGYEFDTK